MLTRMLPVLLIAVLATAATAQDVISARAGFVNYKHGQVTLPTGRDGKALRQIEEGQSVSTQHGRVELLLTPGSFLRLDHESKVRLVSSRLEDVRVELLEGTATVEVNEIPKQTSLTLLWREQSVPIARTGLYRFEAESDSMRIYVGKGKLQLAGAKSAIKPGKYADLAPAGTLSAVAKYNRKDEDEFDSWSRYRGEQLALASYAAANTFLRRPFSFHSSLWYLNPFGFYTYLPYSSTVISPYGFAYYCPRTLYVYHQPSYSSGSHGGGGMVAGGGGGSSVTSTPPPTSSSGRTSGAREPGEIRLPRQKVPE